MLLNTRSNNEAKNCSDKLGETILYNIYGGGAIMFFAFVLILTDIF